MNYRRDSVSSSKRIAIIVLIAIAILVFIYDDETASFLGSTTEGISIRFFSLFSQRDNLSELEKLKSEIESLKARNSDYEKLFSENIELKALFGRKNNKETILAGILSKPPNSPYDTFILDVGREDGVVLGSKVIAYGKVTIGEISEVYEKTSKAVLYSSPGEKFEAFAGEKRIPLTVYGRGGGNYEAEIPRDVILSQGDLILGGGLFPYTLGSVENVFTDPRSPFQRALIRSPINIFELSWIEIIKE